MNCLESQFAGLFIAFPGSEEKLGSCLSAGRGFVHISVNGDVEPCPLVTYSDSNLGNLSLREALQSEFLRGLRRHRPMQAGVREGACVLRENTEWVRALLHSKDNSSPKGNGSFGL